LAAGGVGLVFVGVFFAGVLMARSPGASGPMLGTA